MKLDLQLAARLALTMCCALGFFLPTAAWGQTVTYPNFRPAGRVMLDAASYQDDRNGMSSGMEVRRARIAVVGNLAEGWSFMVEADAADEGMTVRDAWVMYTASPHLRVQAGNIKEPLTLEGATSHGGRHGEQRLTTECTGNTENYKRQFKFPFSNSNSN